MHHMVVFGTPGCAPRQVFLAGEQTQTLWVCSGSVESPPHPRSPGADGSHDPSTNSLSSHSLVVVSGHTVIPRRHA